MARWIDNGKNLFVNDLNLFVPTYKRNNLSFSFLENDLNLETGKKILDFLEKLRQRGVHYTLDISALPKCIFNSEQRETLKSFKKPEEKITKCLRCISFLRKECKGIAEGNIEPEEETVFDFFTIDCLPYFAVRKDSSQICAEEIKVITNRILDKMFEVKSSNAEVIFWDYPGNHKVCDYDFMFHFIEAKLVLGKKDDLLKNKKLISLVKRTYEERKSLYMEKEELVPRDNRWTKLIIMMNRLDLLSKEGREFWIKKYAYYRFSESEPKMPQAWNRVWVFTEGLGIINIGDLKNVKGIDFDKAKKIICSYVPELWDVFGQNVFNEPKGIMLNKYVRIRNFCNQPLFKEIEYLLK